MPRFRHCQLPHTDNHNPFRILNVFCTPQTLFKCVGCRKDKLLLHLSISSHCHLSLVSLCAIFSSYSVPPSWKQPIAWATCRAYGSLHASTKRTLVVHVSTSAAHVFPLWRSSIPLLLMVLLNQQMPSTVQTNMFLCTASNLWNCSFEGKIVATWSGLKAWRSWCCQVCHCNVNIL